jgi:glucose-1-phosphate thymidylyltransferase
MKAIIPVAGIGSMLRPHTHTVPKTLVPVAGKPILAHIVDELYEKANIDSFVFVIGYLGDKIESYIKEHYPNLKTEFVVQEPREGLGQAIWLTKDKIVNEDKIIIVLGDTIANVDFKKIIDTPNSVLGVKKVDTPGAFGVAEVNENGKITKLIEKPKIPKSNLALVGIYKIDTVKKLVEALDYNISNNIKTNNEFHLTDALMKLIEANETFTVSHVDNWYDCGKKETLLEANAILLNRNIDKLNTPQFPNTIIVPPVSIGNNCKLINSIIGPNVAIGDNSTISYSIVKDSIIGSYSEICNAALHHTIIGNDASLKGMSQSLNLGDNTEINFGN